MDFKGLEIKQSYEKQASGDYGYVWVGKFNVVTSGGSEIALRVDKDLCRKLIALCADNIVAVATEAANSMKAEVLIGVSEVKELEVGHD